MRTGCCKGGLCWSWRRVFDAHVEISIGAAFYCWVDSELGAMPSEPCQPGVTRANTELTTPVSFAKQSWFRARLSPAAAKQTDLLRLNARLISEIETKDALCFKCGIRDLWVSVKWKNTWSERCSFILLIGMDAFDGERKETQSKPPAYSRMLSMFFAKI